MAVHGKVLVVEDYPLNMELVTDLLEASGFVVLQATSAEQGLGIAARERPDIILMDVSLPGLDGLAAVERLQMDRATRTIPVVAVTAHAMTGDRERALAAGCVAHLTKPLDTREFPSQIAGLIARHALGATETAE